jgi:hypothetical protein
LIGADELRIEDHGLAAQGPLLRAQRHCRHITDDNELALRHRIAGLDSPVERSRR